MKLEFISSKILKIILSGFKKIVWFLGLYAFWIIIILVFIDTIFGGIIFYNYVYLAEQEIPDITNSIIKFDANAYQNVVNELQAKGQSSQAPQLEVQPNVSEASNTFIEQLIKNLPASILNILQKPK